MKDYRVTIEIDVYADTPRDAAEQAWALLYGHGRPVCDVTPEGGETVRIDLAEGAGS